MLSKPGPEWFRKPSKRNDFALGPDRSKAGFRVIGRGFLRCVKFGCEIPAERLTTDRGPDQEHGGPRGSSASPRRNLANRLNQVSPTSGLTAADPCLQLPFQGQTQPSPALPATTTLRSSPSSIPFIIQLLGAGSPGAGEGSRVEAGEGDWAHAGQECPPPPKWAH